MTGKDAHTTRSRADISTGKKKKDKYDSDAEDSDLDEGNKKGKKKSVDDTKGGKKKKKDKAKEKSPIDNLVEKLGRVCTTTVIKIATVVAAILLVMCAFIRFSYLTGESEEEAELKAL